MLLETGHLGVYGRSNESDNVYPAVTNGTNAMNINNREIRSNGDGSEITIGGGTAIQNFYAGQSVFITGGTGFLGKILTEKLLRSCPEISTIYLLIRGKRGKNVQDRIEDQFNEPIYDRLREEFPKFRHKLVAISGDCGVRGLGLSSADRERLVQEVSIVFHSAATVRFDEKLDVAAAINVGGTSDMIDLCKSMKKLIAFVHVSTAYANSQKSHIDEKFYSHSTTYEDLCSTLKGLNDEEITKVTRKVLGPWPNTYSFTKALAEITARDKCQGLSMGIFRPAIIISTACEPIPGWIDNLYGPTGVVAGVSSGIIQTIHCHSSIDANVVPVDFTVNALIACAWDVANHPERRGDNMLIYNYVSSVESNLTWRKFTDINLAYSYEYPFSKAKRIMKLSIRGNWLTTLIYRIYLHYIPALLVDSFCICLGCKPTLLNTYKKVHKFLDALEQFSTYHWTFTNDNVQSMWERLEAKDKQHFHFTMKDFNWREYFRDYMLGVRKYLLKDDISTVEASRKNVQRLRWIDETINVLLYTLLFWLLWTFLAAILF